MQQAKPPASRAAQSPKLQVASQRDQNEANRDLKDRARTGLDYPEPEERILERGHGSC